MGTIVTTRDGRLLLNPKRKEIRKAFGTEKPVPKGKKPRSPKVGAGYLRDLLARMQSEEDLPRPKGAPQSSEYTVRWQAHREAECLNDPILLTQTSEFLIAAKTSDDFSHLCFVLCWLYHNTKSVRVSKELGKVLERVPPKRNYLRRVFHPLQNAPSAVTRAFAVKFIPNADYSLEGDAIDVLGAAKKPEDFKLLARLLFSGKLHECNLWNCVIALAQVGRKRSVPLLKKFVKTHQENQRWEYQQAVEWAEEELESLN